MTLRSNQTQLQLHHFSTSDMAHANDHYNDYTAEDTTDRPSNTTADTSIHGKARKPNNSAEVTADTSIEVDVDMLDDTTSDTIAAAHSQDKPVIFNDLPNETLLAIVARIPYSGADLLNLSLANKHMYQLLKERKMQIQNDIAKIQFAESCQLRLREGSFTKAELHQLRSTKSDVSSILGDLQCTTRSSDQLCNDSVLVAGLYIFETISLLMNDFQHEIVTKAFFGMFDIKIWSILRYTSTWLAEELRDSLRDQDQDDLAVMFDNCKAPLAIEELMLRRTGFSIIKAISLSASMRRQGIKYLGWDAGPLKAVLPEFFKTFTFYKYLLENDEDLRADLRAEFMFFAIRQPWSLYITQPIFAHQLSEDKSKHIMHRVCIKADTSHGYDTTCNDRGEQQTGDVERAASLPPYSEESLLACGHNPGVQGSSTASLETKVTETNHQEIDTQQLLRGTGDRDPVKLVNLILKHEVIETWDAQVSVLQYLLEARSRISCSLEAVNVGRKIYEIARDLADGRGSTIEQTLDELQSQVTASLQR